MFAVPAVEVTAGLDCCAVPAPPPPGVPAVPGTPEPPDPPAYSVSDPVIDEFT